MEDLVDLHGALAVPLSLAPVLLNEASNSWHPLHIPAAGLVVFSFLVVEPQDIGFLPQSGSVLGSEVDA